MLVKKLVNLAKSMKKGTVYIFLNPKFPDLIKIGKTARDPVQRAKELSCQTGVPADHIVIYDEIVNDCEEIERKLHRKFAGYRESRHKEFFRVRPTDAIKALHDLAKERRVDLSNVEKSRDILSELKAKYPGSIRADIKEVHIVHKEELCLLESRRGPSLSPGDEIIEYVDLDIFAKSPFVTQRSPNENADEFVNVLDDYDLIMTTNLFDQRAHKKTAKKYESHQSQ